jgi:uncharacterized protein (DUF2252 family)
LQAASRPKEDIMAASSLTESTAAYERWLKEELAGNLVVNDLHRKHKKMAEAPFPFLRATYWRWSETILDICPALVNAPAVLAVGDIHLENFGTWRDVEGRVVWGVNDFDEAAEMPYALDLVRLGVSAALGCPHIDTDAHICDNILRGYTRGLARPHAIVLDQDYAWLRKLTVVSNVERARFWEKVEGLSASKTTAKPPADYQKVLCAALPDPKIPKADVTFTTRTAGAGSLGRPRWVAIADWNGGLVLREGKAIVPSAWTRVGGRRSKAIRCYEIATGRYRAPDPWYHLTRTATGTIVVRRLSPNNRKIEAETNASELSSPKMLRAMGRELAAVHLGTADRRAAIERDLGKRKRNWLFDAVERAADFVRGDYADWRRMSKKRNETAVAAE